MVISLVVDQGSRSGYRLGPEDLGDEDRVIAARGAGNRFRLDMSDTSFEKQGT
jgi:hypothetical protein